MCLQCCLINFQKDKTLKQIIIETTKQETLNKQIFSLFSLVRFHESLGKDFKSFAVNSLSNIAV